ATATVYPTIITSFDIPDHHTTIEAFAVEISKYAGKVSAFIYFCFPNHFQRTGLRCTAHRTCGKKRHKNFSETRTIVVWQSTRHFRTHLQKVFSACSDFLDISKPRNPDVCRNLTQIISDQV